MNLRILPEKLSEYFQPVAVGKAVAAKNDIQRWGPKKSESLFPRRGKKYLKSGPSKQEGQGLGNKPVGFDDEDSHNGSMSKQSGCQGDRTLRGRSNGFGIGVTNQGIRKTNGEMDQSGEFLPCRGVLSEIITSVCKQTIVTGIPVPRYLRLPGLLRRRSRGLGIFPVYLPL